MTRSERAGRDQRGFTMVELMIATAILGLVMAGLLGLLSASKDAYSRGSNTIEAQQNARVALERMAKEIREAGYHPRPPDTLPATCPPGPGSLYPSGGGSDAPCWSFYPITSQTATALTLQFDWNGDGVISTSGKVTDAACPVTPCRGEQVTYSLSGTTLMRQEVGVDLTPQEIATGVTSLAIKYYKDPPTGPGTYDTAAETTSRDLIRTVGITITAKPGTDGASATMRDMIRLRIR